MAFWQTLLIHIVATAVTVTLVLSVFYWFILKPFLNRKVEQLIAATDQLEPKVRAGVKQGVSESLKELPDTAAKESTRQFLRFGSDLFENGLSSFLGTAEDLARRSNGRERPRNQS